MTSLRTLVIALALVAGCYYSDPTPASTFPQPQPMQVQGPPGGGMDPSYAYASPGYTAPDDGDNGYDDPNSAAQTTDPGDDYDPSAQVADPDGPTSPVTDTEIDATLDGYGSWEDDPEYGRVWRPDATVVGVDFTPYETCGSWVYTDDGWSFDCSDWSWGWLPFHYGNWTWCDGGYWGWVPGHRWAPAWVQWRYGNGYVGWRPIGPKIRDHRHPEHPSQWRFASTADFGRPHIRAHEFVDPAEGLRLTQPVRHPGFRPPTPPVHVASLMRPRFATPTFTRGVGGTYGRGYAGTGPAPVAHPYRPGARDVQDEVTWRPHPTYAPQTWQRPAAAYGAGQAYRPPAEAYHPPVQSWHPPVQPYRPAQGWRPPATSGGFGGGYHPSGGYRPAGGSFGGGYHPSSGGFHPSGGGGYHPAGGGMHFGGGGGRHR